MKCQSSEIQGGVSISQKQSVFFMISCCSSDAMIFQLQWQCFLRTFTGQKERNIVQREIWNDHCSNYHAVREIFKDS